MKNVKVPSIGIYYDTEFDAKSQELLSVQLLLKVDPDQLTLADLDVNELMKETLVINSEDINNDFNPIHECTALRLFDEIRANEISNDLNNLTKIFEEKYKENHSYQVSQLIELPVTQHFCSKWNVNPKSIIKKSIPKVKDSIKITLNLNTFKVYLTAHFADVDLFRVFGHNWQFLLLNSVVSQKRTLQANISSFAMWGNQLSKVEIILKDTMHRFPPIKKGLLDQCRALGVSEEFWKYDIIREDIAKKMGVECTKNAIMGNIKVLKEIDYPEFKRYGAMDCVATLALDLTQKELFGLVRAELGLPVKSSVADTTGSNVSSVIKDLIHKHYETSNPQKLSLKALRKRNNTYQTVQETKSRFEVVRSLLSQTTVKNTQVIHTNELGFVPLRTVGGLLYSRMAKHPFVSGMLGDLDIAGAYSTAMSNMNVYIGQPQIICYHKTNNPPTLREIIEDYNIPGRCPRDGWFVRVSGNLNKAVNTLILSDLRYEGKAVLTETIDEVINGDNVDKSNRLKNRKHIEQFNIDSISVQNAESCILTKEIVHGLVNQSLLEVLQLLPKDWYEEYLNLKVDTVVFVENDLICESFEEFEEMHNSKPFQKKDRINLETQQIVPSTKNVCLRFPISEYWKTLKDIRTKHKKAKNPIQEIYKLILNSGYGALACVHLPVNNLLASNTITANIRSVAWLMMNALNGFQVITDGCTFSYDSIPVGLNFRELVSANPEYLVSFTPEIQSGIKPEDCGLNWIGSEYKKHLANFYGLSSDSYLVKTFDYELKDESFDGKSHVTFNEFWNNNSGNYTKAFKLENETVEVVRSIKEKEAFTLDDEPETIRHTKLKARGFKTQDESLWDWYSRSIKSSYSEHKYITDFTLTKFRDSCQDAITLLGKNDEIRLPCGFTKYIVKVPKLISRSQFLFKTRDQLKTFEKAQMKLDQISNQLISRNDWEELKLEDLTEFGITELKYSPEEYFAYSKEHSIGLGWEVLCPRKQQARCKTIGQIRIEIYQKIQSGDSDFSKLYAELLRKKKLGEYVKPFLMACTVFKKHYEEQFITLCLDRLSDPTSFRLTRDNVRYLREFYPS